MDGCRQDAHPFISSSTHLVRGAGLNAIPDLRTGGRNHTSKQARRGQPATSGSPAASAKNKLSTRISINFDTASSSTDSPNIQTGTSVKAIHDIISRFSDTKKRLVEEIGFGGLLKFPQIKSTNRKFSAWLMSLVDVKNSCLALENGGTLQFLSEDIGIVFGIPCTGRNISDAGHMEKEAKGKVRLQCWPQTGKDNQSIKAIEEVVDARYEDPMTPDQEDAFKVAFVVFVMSTLFVPGAKHDYACIDYWGVLSNPKIIHEFNWAEYIHSKLLAAASKYKYDLETGSRAPIMTGCYLFLQVFYLDNMDIPVWGMDHTVKPRIACFTYEKIRNMISADTLVRQEGRSDPVYGNSKVRPREQSCYSWAQPDCDRPMDAYTKATTSLWQAVISLVTILRLPLEAAGPLFISAAELNRPDEASVHRSPIECIAILLKIVEPFQKGFKYNFDLHGHQDVGDQNLPDILRRYCAATEYGDSAFVSGCMAAVCAGHNSDSDISSFQAVVPSASPKRRKVGANGGPSDLLAQTSQTSVVTIDYSVIKFMARFYMLIRFARERNQLDLNADSIENCSCQAMLPASEVQIRGAAKTPWELGDNFANNSLNIELPGSQGGAPDGSTLNLSWSMPHIVDYQPKYIEVLPVAAKEQMLGVTELEMDMFDAIIRSFKLVDDALYAAEGNQRWRHFFESDILAAMLAGCFDVNNPSMQNQFIGSHISYRIYSCTMLYFPVILHERWVCFAWNLKENSIIVFDPTCINIPGFSVRSTYKHAADVLKKTMASVIPVLFPGWHHDWIGATLLPFHWHAAGVAWPNRTGILCAYFCRCFNGKELQPAITQGQIKEVGHTIFEHVKAVHDRLRHRGASAV